MESVTDYYNQNSFTNYRARMSNYTMKYLPIDHTFAICAYKESPFLEECIRSLMGQTVKSNIILCTSTPNHHIQKLSEKYRIALFVNDEALGLASDWNYAYTSANTELVTLAHQDDVYEADYTEIVISQVNHGGNTQIIFTDYYEIQNGRRMDSKQFLNLRIKKLLLSPLRMRVFQSSTWIRRRVLSLGNPIGCPSVTYVKGNLPATIFETKFSSNVDWMAWEQLSRREGRFLYIPQTLMGHRIYVESTTVQMINNDGARTREDYEMLKKFWPVPVAKAICRLYAQSQRQRKHD